MEPRNGWAASDHWVRGGVLLVITAMVMATQQSIAQLVGPVVSSLVAGALLIIALAMLVRDTSSNMAMLADRRLALTGAALMSIGVLGTLVVLLVPSVPSPSAIITAVTFLIEGVTLVGIGTLAWAAWSSPRIAQRHRTVMGVAAVLIIATRLAMLLVSTLPLMSPELLLPIYSAFATTHLLVMLFGMLAIGLAVILSGRAATDRVAEATDTQTAPAHVSIDR